MSSEKRKHSKLLEIREEPCPKKKKYDEDFEEVFKLCPRGTAQCHLFEDNMCEFVPISVEFFMESIVRVLILSPKSTNTSISDIIDQQCIHYTEGEKPKFWSPLMYLDRNTKPYWIYNIVPNTVFVAPDSLITVRNDWLYNIPSNYILNSHVSNLKVESSSPSDNSACAESQKIVNPVKINKDIPCCSTSNEIISKQSKNIPCCIKINKDIPYCSTSNEFISKDIPRCIKVPKDIPCCSTSNEQFISKQSRFFISDEERKTEDILRKLLNAKRSQNDVEITDTPSKSEALVEDATKGFLFHPPQWYVAIISDFCDHLSRGEGLIFFVGQNFCSHDWWWLLPYVLGNIDILYALTMKIDNKLPLTTARINEIEKSLSQCINMYLRTCPSVKDKIEVLTSVLSYTIFQDMYASSVLLINANAQICGVSPYNIPFLNVTSAQMLDLCIRCRVDVNIANYEGDTLLIRSAKLQNHMLMHKLVNECNADITVTNVFGMSALMCFVSSKPLCLSALVKSTIRLLAGYDGQVLNKADCLGNTAYFYAAMIQSPLLSHLVKIFGEPPDTKNIFGLKVGDYVSKDYSPYVKLPNLDTMSHSIEAIRENPALLHFLIRTVPDKIKLLSEFFDHFKFLPYFQVHKDAIFVNDIMQNPLWTVHSQKKAWTFNTHYRRKCVEKCTDDLEINEVVVNHQKALDVGIIIHEIRRNFKHARRICLKLC